MDARPHALLPELKLEKPAFKSVALTICWQGRLPEASEGNSSGQNLLVIQDAQRRVLEKHIGETEEPPALAAKLCCHSSRAMADYVSEHR